MKLALTRWERPAYYMDLYRAWPRAVLLGCALMIWRVTEWFMGLPEPSMAQGTFVSVVYGATPLILNFYMSAGINWDARRLPPPTPAAPPVTTTTTTRTGDN